MLFSEVTRKQAFLTHLGVSTAIFAVLCLLIVFVWYPDFYFFTDGGVRAIATVFFVDVVLGPGLTLLVFKPGKKFLKFDIGAILVLQFTALVWGVSNVYSERPAASVYYQGSLTCIAQPDAGNMDLPAIVSGPSGRQRLAFLQRPDTVDGLLEFTKQAYAHNSSAVYYYSDRIVPLDQRVRERLDKYELDWDWLLQNEPDYAARVQQFIHSKGYTARHYKLVPLRCRYQQPLAVLDTRVMRVVDWMQSPAYLITRALDEPLPLSTALR